MVDLQLFELNNQNQGSEAVDLDYVKGIKDRCSGAAPKYRSPELPRVARELTMEDLKVFGTNPPDISRADDWTLTTSERLIGADKELQDEAYRIGTSGADWWGKTSFAGWGPREPKALGSYRRKSKDMKQDEVLSVIDEVDTDELRSRPVEQFVSKIRKSESNPMYRDFVTASSTSLPTEEDFWVDGIWQNEDFVLSTFGV